MLYRSYFFTVKAIPMHCWHEKKTSYTENGHNTVWSVVRPDRTAVQHAWNLVNVAEVTFILLYMLSHNLYRA